MSTLDINLAKHPTLFLALSRFETLDPNGASATRTELWDAFDDGILDAVAERFTVEINDACERLEKELN